MTRNEMISAVEAVRDDEFRNEVEHFMSVDREYEYDPVCALLDITDRAEEHKNYKLLRIARSALIDIGFYRVMDDEEAENTFTSNGRVPWEFKIKGVRYVSDETVEEWMGTE